MAEPRCQRIQAGDQILAAPSQLTSVAPLLRRQRGDRLTWIRQVVGDGIGPADSGRNIAANGSPVL